MARPIEISNDQIIEASRKLFFTNGIYYTEMKSIALHCKIGRSTLYRRFKTKEDIALLIASRILMEINEATNDGLKKPAKNGLEAVANGLDAAIDYFVHHIDDIRFLDEFDSFFSTYPDSEEAANFVATIQYAVSHRFKPYIVMGMQDGSVRPVDDPGLTNGLLSNAILAMAQRVLPRREVLDKEQGYAVEFMYALRNSLVDSLKYKTNV